MITGYQEVTIDASPELLRAVAATLAVDPDSRRYAAELRATADALEETGRATRLNPPTRVIYRIPEANALEAP